MSKAHILGGLLIVLIAGVLLAERSNGQAQTSGSERFQLCPAKYKANTTTGSATVEGLFKIDPETGRTWEDEFVLTNDKLFRSWVPIDNK